jgi:hypothetical protein
MGVDHRWEANQKVYVAAQSTASEIVPALEDIIETGLWREFPHPIDGFMKFDRFSDYCKDFLGMNPEAIEALLDKSFLRASAAKVRKMLRQDIPVLATHGGNRPTINQVDNINLTVGGSDPAYVVARLKRDDPALAEQVVNGELSANAAAIKAGIKRPRAQILVDNPDDAIRGLRKHFSKEELRDAIDRAN